MNSHQRVNGIWRIRLSAFGEMGEISSKFYKVKFWRRERDLTTGPFGPSAPPRGAPHSRIAPAFKSRRRQSSLPALDSISFCLIIPFYYFLAEREGFEPPVRLRVQLISSQPPSTARPSLREYFTIAELYFKGKFCCYFNRRWATSFISI